MSVRDEIVFACQKIPSGKKLRVAEDATLIESRFTWIGVPSSSLCMWDDASEAQALPLEFLQRVFVRYGQTLGRVGDIIAHVEVPQGGTLAHMLYVPEFDVEPKDYLVWLPNEGEPTFALSALLVPPLRHLLSKLSAASIPRGARPISH